MECAQEMTDTRTFAIITNTVVSIDKIKSFSDMIVEAIVNFRFSVKLSIPWVVCTVLKICKPVLVV